MSKAKKCDRCGKYYDPYSTEILLAEGALQNVIDLCPECEKELKQWIKPRVKITEERKLTRNVILKNYDLAAVMSNPPELLESKMMRDYWESLKPIIKPHIKTEKDYKHNTIRCELEFWL